MTLRYGVLAMQELPIPELVQRYRWLEELGFDAAYVADQTGDFRNLDGLFWDGWTVLPALAAGTSRIRLGPLVSTPLMRSPVLLAMEATAFDHMSGGRLDLGLGTGIAGFDHAAMGIPYWEPKERVARFTEYVEVVDGLLRSPAGSYGYVGRYFRTEGSPIAAPVQQPRPPITIGGQSPTVRKVAARFGDCWNTHGPYGASLAEVLEITARQNAEMDELCESFGRRPSDMRRSVLLFEGLDPWVTGIGMDELVDRFRKVGVTEFILMWPPSGREGELEKLAASLPRG